MSVSRFMLALAVLLNTAVLWAEKPNVIPLATTSTWSLVDSRNIPLAGVQQWGENAALAKECGVKAVQLRTYTLYPENDSVNVLIEAATDETSAYSLFTLYRDESMTPVADLPSTEVSSGSAILRRGNKFIHIFAPDAAAGKGAGSQKGRQFPFTLSQLHGLLLAVGGPVQAAEDAHGMPGALPPNGLVQGSEKYMLGEESAKLALPQFQTSLLGFSQGAEARVAAYRSGGNKMKVLAVTYPTPQIARQRFGAMQDSLQVNQPKGSQSVYGKSTGSYVILVFDATSQTSATKVLNLFNSTGYVTWNQRYEGDEPIVIQMVRFVLANIIFSFILIGFALMGGLLFFGSKVAARKWFPNSAWGQPEGNTIIKLNL